MCFFTTNTLILVSVFLGLSFAESRLVRLLKRCGFDFAVIRGGGG